MAMAVELSKRGDCTRRQVGAIITLDNRIVGHGYNGFAPGAPGCLTAGVCPRGRHYAVDNPVESWRPVCACGHPGWPCPDSVPPGSSYSTPAGRCGAVHAEINAILSVENRRDLPGSTMHVTCEPCHDCRKVIVRVGIERVLWPAGASL